MKYFEQWRYTITIKLHQKSNRNWPQILPGLAVSLVSISLLIYFVDLQKFWLAIKEAQIWLIVTGVLLTIVWLLIRGIAWKTILRDQGTYADVFFTVNEGYLLNNFLPFRLGEIGRALLLSNKAQIDFWEILSSIVVERSFDLALASGLLLSTLPFVTGAPWAMQAALTVGAITLLFFLCLFLLTKQRQKADNFLAQFKQTGSSWFNRIKSMIGGLLTGFEILRDNHQFIRAAIWMVANWLLGIVQYFVFLRAFITEAPILWACFSLGVVALGVAAPSSPGAIGVMELSLVAALSVFGVNPSAALAYAISLHISQYIITGIIGSYALGKDGETLSGLYKKVRNMRSGRRLS